MQTKKIVIPFVLIIIILIFISVLYNKNTNKKVYFEQDGLLLSISDGNGGTLNSVPEAGNYNVTVNCNNGDGSWDYSLWKLVVKNITGNVTCDLTFESIGTSQTFSQYIASLAGTTQGNGQVVNENGYRYEGQDPNNYVWFNNELWRIIGVFPTGRHGVSNDNRTINGTSSTYLVKIIRAESLGGYSWAALTPTTNNWATSTLFRMLNGCYYNALTGSSQTNITGTNSACSNYCIGHYGDVNSMPTSNCDFSVNGLQNDGVNVGYRDMVQKVTWYLGGPGKTNYTNYSVSNIYNYETNSSAVYSGRTATISAYVGLMYASDFGYSVLNSDCARSSHDMTEYNSPYCAGKSWLYGKGSEWTITHDSGTPSGAWSIASIGSIGNSSMGNNASGLAVAYGCTVRPVVYLKSRSYKLAGTGTKSDPYIVNSVYERTFDYSSSVQTLTITKAGYYKLEVYGAKGGNGNNNTSYAGGNGGYASGVVHLNANDILYVHTGGAGKGSTSKAVQSGGTNGGGAGGYNYGASGGGGTDIRINTDSLYARVIVGGGGGGGAYYSGYTGGAGGGTTGGNGTGYSTTYNAKGGGTTSGGSGGSYNGGNYKGSNGSFGTGGAAATSTTNNYGRSGGGGGGWYGGGGGGYRANSSSYNRGQSGGGGGSSYTYSSTTASQVPSGWLLSTDYQMTSTSTTSGVNSGDGYAIVTYCGQAPSDCS